MKIDFESKPVYGDDDKYIKTKIKTYEKSIIRNFHNTYFTYFSNNEIESDIDNEEITC